MHVREATLADAPGIARVHVDSWRTTYPGIVPQAFLDSISYAQRETMWRQILSPHSGEAPLSQVFVAQDTSDRIVGFVSGGDVQGSYPPYDGELYAIYLLKESQRQGIGQRLTRTLVKRLLARDVKACCSGCWLTIPPVDFTRALAAMWHTNAVQRSVE